MPMDGFLILSLQVMLPTYVEDPVIITLFGDQWGAAAPIASILAIWGGIVSIHAFYGPLLISLGKEKLFGLGAQQCCLAEYGRDKAVNPKDAVAACYRYKAFIRKFIYFKVDPAAFRSNGEIQCVVFRD